MPSVTGQETRPRAYQDRISRLDATGVGSLGQRSRDFLLWALVSFLVARHRGRLISGVAAGLTIALGTFLVYDLLILVRVNLLLGDPTGRADWQDMMARFQASEISTPLPEQVIALGCSGCASGARRV